MSTHTHTMPDGQRVRTASQRRFVLWRQGGDGRWFIVRRSDTRAKLEAIGHRLPQHITDAHARSVEDRS